MPSIAANREFSSKSLTYGDSRLTTSSSVAGGHSENQRIRSIRRSGIRTYPGGSLANSASTTSSTLSREATRSSTRSGNASCSALPM